MAPQNSLSVVIRKDVCVFISTTYLPAVALYCTYLSEESLTQIQLQYTLLALTLAQPSLLLLIA